MVISKKINSLNAMKMMERRWDWIQFRTFVSKLVLSHLQWRTFILKLFGILVKELWMVQWGNFAKQYPALTKFLLQHLYALKHTDDCLRRFFQSEGEGTGGIPLTWDTISWFTCISVHFSWMSSSRLPLSPTPAVLVYDVRTGFEEVWGCLKSSSLGIHHI